MWKIAHCDSCHRKLNIADAFKLGHEILSRTPQKNVTH